MYNLPGNSKLLEDIGEKSNRLSWDPVNNKSLIIHNVTKKDSGVYLSFGNINRIVDIHNVYVRGK